VALPFTLKKMDLKTKEELWKLKYFTIQKCNLHKKKSSKRNQNPSRYYNSRTNLKFQHKPGKKIIFQKSSYKKKQNRPIIIYYLGAKIPQAITILYNESKHNILALVGKANKLTE
jgi:hypothetical protein